MRRYFALLLWWWFAATAAAAQPDGLPLEPARRLTFETDTATWIALDLSPDGSRIVTSILGDLYVVPAAGGHARRITSGMAFDSQPVFSPDGKRIAFISDRSGGESLWIINSDGGDVRRISAGEDDILVSPEWSADGRSIFVSRFLPSLGSYELWRFDSGAAGSGTLLVPAKVDGDFQSSLGAWPTPDGRAVLFARAKGRIGDALPAWTIVRRDLSSGTEDLLVSAPASPRSDLILGSFFRPALSPDGKLLVYGSRHEGQTGLRLLDLQTGKDRWLAYPVEHDAAQASAWLDLLPRFDFTADGQAVLIDRGGKISRISLADGKASDVPFSAKVDIGLGPSLRTIISEPTGPVRARIIQHAVPSPDGKSIAFSALGRVYVMELRRDAKPKPVTTTQVPAFMPSWSPDGRSLAFVTWTARDAGHVWTTAASGRGRPRRVSTHAAYYTFPVFAPDGRTIIAVRSSSSVRMKSYMEFGPHRRADLITIAPHDGKVRVLASGVMGGRPHFGPERNAVYVAFADGLNRVALDGSGRTRIAQVTGPGWYFSETPATAEDIRISPDGQWVLAQLSQQLHLIRTPVAGETVKTEEPSVFHRKLTKIGADFFEWGPNGRTIHWMLGSTFHSRSLTNAIEEVGAQTAMREVVVELPRDLTQGSLLLRGATLLTMRGEETIADADLLIVRNRIAAVGPRGSFAIPAGTAIRDASGKFIIPGLIDAHDHYADIRRGVLDFESWGPRSNLAYGVTTGFDPSTLSIDTIAYEDAISAGLMVGSRMPSTGPAIFSFNRFDNLDEVRSVLRRYRDHYGIRNLKQYRSGNRRVRQWIAIASRELGMLPTTEGALSLKLDLTQIIDGFPGHEHALPVVPLGKDLIELVARSGTSYTTTLQIGNGGPEAQDYFITRASLSQDPKLNHFSPRFVVNVKTRQRTWRQIDEYLFPAIGRDAARIKRAGGLVAMGSHGEMPGIAMHWEMEAHVMGGMTPMEALHSATMGSAAAIGRSHEFGSLEVGKYADLVMLSKDPRVNIRNSLAIEKVMKNGRLYAGDTLDEIWPRQRSLPAPWYRREDPPSGSIPDQPALPDLNHAYGHGRTSR